MKKGFRILKFKKDKPILELKDISKSFDGRPILKKLSMKVFLVSVSVYSDLMVLEKQHYFLCVLANKMSIVEKSILMINQ